MEIIKMKFYQIILLICLMLVVSCSTNYRYTSKGKVTLLDKSEYNAVLYWNNLLGRTWYGGKIDIYASDVSLKVCTEPVYVFSTNNKNALFLPGKGGDKKTHTISDDQALELTSPPTFVTDGDKCGIIQVANKEAKVRDIKLGETPLITILCKSDTVNRYPQPGQYIFNSVIRREIPKGTNTKEPLVCE
jgi:hypothetical protein